MRLFVTGNIGCAKSTVCQMLRQHLPQYEFFSVDDAVHEMYANPRAQADLERNFGTSDRRALSDLVFSDPAKRRKLEALSTRYVSERLEQALQHPRVVVEFPLFFEFPSWLARADFVLGLGCEESVQKDRVLRRDGITEEKFERIRASQHSSSLKMALADASLNTGGTLADLEAAVAALVPQLKIAELRARCNVFFGSKSVWPRIEAAYSEPHRAYHNLTHLMELFEGFDRFPGLPHRQSVEMAIWFHDFVYSTELASYSQNEALSAKALFSVLKEHAPAWLAPLTAPTVLLAAELILATRTHQLTEPFLRATAERQRAAEVFLDLDLSVLASSEERVQAYDAAIAAEWASSRGLTPQQFAVGRADALNRFLERPRLYLSPELASQELAARLHLVRLRSQWSTKASGRP